MRLKREVFKGIRNSILDAFTPQSLKSMLKIEMDVVFNEIVKPGTFKDQVDDLVQWAERHDRVEEFILAARAANPTNKVLEAAEETFFASQIENHSDRDIPLDQAGVRSQRVADRPPPTSLPQSHVGSQTLVNPPSSNHLIGFTYADLNLDSLTPVELIAETHHSIIVKCYILGKPYALKRTVRRLCDEEALINLMKVKADPFSNHGSFRGIYVTIAVPLALWRKNEYIWQLYRYFDGISLDKVIKQNKYSIRGAYLSRIYEALIQAINQVHEIGVLHRDINPTNILLLDGRTIAVLDPTFCCMQDSQNQIPLANQSYAPPEQSKGNADLQSDWYSIASTVYFLANKMPPPTNAGFDFYDVGPYGNVFYGHASKLLQLLLARDIYRRPSEYHKIHLSDITFMRENLLNGVLDLGRFGYLATDDANFTAFSNRQELDGYLLELELMRQKQSWYYFSDGLESDIEDFRKGLNPWLIG